MRKTVKRGMLFVLILAVILAGASVWTRKRVIKYAGYIEGRNRPTAMLSAEPAETIDVLVLGDSESYTSVSTMDLWKEHGITAFDCGQGGQRIQETYYMLKTALQRQSPKVVVLETNVMFRNPGPFKNTQIALAEMLRYYFPVFRYHNLWKTIFEEKPEEISDYKGFRIREKIIPYQGGEYMKETKETAEISPFVEHYMKGIRRLCGESGAKLLLVSAPSPVNYNYKKHNTIQAYADRYSIPYIDLNMKTEELGIDWEKDSMDKGDHLNVYGAEKVTAYLGRYLVEHYSLEDHRADEAYAKWNELAEKYEKELEERTGTRR